MDELTEALRGKLSSHAKADDVKVLRNELKEVTRFFEDTSNELVGKFNNVKTDV